LFARRNDERYDRDVPQGSRLLRDLKYALRRLAAARVFTVFSVVTLALGIGVTTAAYSVIYALLWRPMNFPEAGRVAFVTHIGGTPPGSLFRLLSWPDFLDLEQSQTSFSGVAASTAFGAAMSAAGRAQLVSAEAVTGSYFGVVAVPALAGRVLQPADAAPDSQPVAVLAERVWRMQFGADPSIVGRLVKINNYSFEIVGVMPSAFRGTDRRAAPDVWMTLRSAALVNRFVADGLDPSRRRRRWLTVLGRLRPGQSAAAAAAEIAAIGQRLNVVDPIEPPPADSVTPGLTLPRQWSLVAITDDAGPAARSAIGVLVVAVPALVLLVACTNLANLVLSRGVTRKYVHAVRRAFGASRWDVIREQLVESGIVAVIGAAGGLATAHLLLALLARIAEYYFGYAPQFRVDAALEPSVLGAAVLAMLLALTVSGLVPAFQLTRTSTYSLLGMGGGGSTTPRWRGRGNLIALQVGVSVGLLLITALLVRQLAAESPSDEGLDLRHVALVHVPFSVQQRDEAPARQTIDAILANVQALPGVESASAASFSDAVGGARAYANVTVPDRPFTATDEGEQASVVTAGPTVFRTLGLPLVRGRGFDDRDVPGAPEVVVLGEALALGEFGTVEVVGREVLVTFSSDAVRARGRMPPVHRLSVVGVAANSHFNRRGQPELTLFVPFAQRFEPDIDILARSSGSDVKGLVQGLRTSVQRADPDLAISIAGRADLVSRWAPEVVLGLTAAIAGSLASLALVLAMAGLYGVLSQVVAEQTREMGVRLALGATEGRLVRQVLWQGARPVLEGVVIGLGAATLIRLGMQPYLARPVAAVDPIAFTAAAVPLVVAAVLACYVPARRASRVDPTVALRHL